MPNAQEILERFKGMESARSTLSTLWEDMARFVDPQRADVLTKRNLGDKRAQPLDITANKAIENLTAGLYSTIINPGDEWFNLKPSDTNLSDIWSVNVWLEQVRDLMMAKFSSNGNRFYSQTGGMLKDLVVFGTAFFYIEEIPGTGEISYKCIHPKNCFIESNNIRVIDTVGRRSMMTARSAILEFGDNCSDQIKRAFEKNPNEMFEILHFVTPYMEGTQKVKKQGKSFYSCFIDVQNKFKLRENGYYEMPYMTPRWMVRGEFDYGESPVFSSIASIKMLNKMKYVTISAGEMVLQPPILAQSELATRANYQTTPGQILYGTLDAQGRPMMQPLQNGAQVNFGIEMMEIERDDINAAFHRDALLMTQNQDRTATEALIIQEERQKQLSYYFGQLQNEFFDPVITRQFNIMFRSGELPEPPDELKINPNVDIEYVSPLARTQKSSQGMAMMRGVQAITPYAQLDPSILDVVNFDQYARKILDAFGAKSTILRSEEDIEKLREDRANQQQAQQLLVAAQPVANAAKSAAQASQISNQIDREQ